MANEACELKLRSIVRAPKHPFLGNWGPALTAVWSKAPPLTARCLSPLPGFEYRPGHVKKLPVTWG